MASPARISASVARRRKNVSPAIAPNAANARAKTRKAAARIRWRRVSRSSMAKASGEPLGAHHQEQHHDPEDERSALHRRDVQARDRLDLREHQPGEHRALDGSHAPYDHHGEREQDE